MKITPTILLAALWLAMLGWGFYALLRRHVRLDDQLDDKEAELSIERHARHVAERSLANAQLSVCQLARDHESVREKERQRIARDIHDDLGQNLLALKIDLSLLHVSTTGAHPLISQKVDEMIGNIDLTTASLRAIIHDLRPAALDEGFVHAIRWQMGEFTRMHGIRHELQIDAAVLPADADRDLETMLYRIVQESLSNVARHAHATDVIVQLARSGNLLNVKIQDNGIGLPIACDHHGSGLGGMRDRVRALGGHMRIDSMDGIGTILAMSIPLNETLAIS